MVGLIKLLKWIKGRRIKNIKTLENGRKKIIVDDDSIEVEKEIIELLKSYNLRKSLEQTIFVPLDKEGIESITTVEDPQQKEKAVTISKEERIFFATPKQEEEKIEEKIYETSLQLISPVFQEKNKWRFTEGASPFFADIKDEGFINSVQKGDISFSSGDVLTVRLHKHQYLQEGKIKADYEVLKVLHHRTTAQQIKLPFDES